MECKHCGSEMYVASSGIIKGNPDTREIKYSCECSDDVIIIIEKIENK